jgi:Clp amino terminal domain, pathogenicity island component
METREHRICRLAEEAASAEDPEAALRTLRELREALEEVERSRVEQALRAGRSFSVIANALGISRQAAHRRYRDLAPGGARRVWLSSHALRAVQLAREEAAAMGARAVATQHVLIGALRSGGGPTIALEAEGITADAARDCVAAKGHGDGNGNGAPRGRADATVRAVLQDAVGIARARHGDAVEVADLVLAALRHPDDSARRAITALGAAPAAVRERLSG